MVTQCHKTCKASCLLALRMLHNVRQLYHRPLVCVCVCTIKLLCGLAHVPRHLKLWPSKQNCTNLKEHAYTHVCATRLWFVYEACLLQESAFIFASGGKKKKYLISCLVKPNKHQSKTSCVFNVHRQSVHFCVPLVLMSTCINYSETHKHNTWARASHS